MKRVGCRTNAGQRGGHPAQSAGYQCLEHISPITNSNFSVIDPKIIIVTVVYCSWNDAQRKFILNINLIN
jgi:hypothetical protein